MQLLQMGGMSPATKNKITQKLLLDYKIASQEPAAKSVRASRLSDDLVSALTTAQSKYGPAAPDTGNDDDDLYS
jgi:hypothetical protein